MLSRFTFCFSKLLRDRGKREKSILSILLFFALLSATFLGENERLGYDTRGGGIRGMKTTHMLKMDRKDWF